MKSKSQKKLIRARKSCKKNNNDQSIYNLVLQLLIAITCSLISSYYSFSFHWISYPALKQLLLNPSSISSFMSPKCLFIAMNIIVIIIFAEWSLTSSPPADIYDEYVKRSRISHRLASVNYGLHEKTVIKKSNEEKPDELDGFRVLEEKKSRIRHRLASVNYDLHGKTIVKKVEDEKPDELVIVEEELEVNDDQVVGVENGDDNKVDEGDDIEFIRTEELNRRVENFIARVNRRMWVEAHCVNVHGEEDSRAGSFDN